MNICLSNMTNPLMHSFFRGFTNDPDVFEDEARFREFQYSPERADQYWCRQRERNRVHLAVMLENEPIGEVILKHIDPERKSCTLSIHMKNDSVKNCGYGTQAEILALRYAFCDLDMKTVFADALIKNTRSRHVLIKVGFREISQNEAYCYYRCDKATWNPPAHCQYPESQL